jgi:hypothetical protein
VIGIQRIALISLLATGLVMSGFSGGEALAKGNKSIVTVKANGKRFKTSKRTAPTASYQNLTGLLIVTCGSQKASIRSVSIKTLTFSTQVGLTTLPVTVPVATALYSDNTYHGISGPGAPKSWTGEGLTVTITKFDGARIAGTFEGTLPPGGGGVTTPATFEKGKFDLPVIVQ